MGSTSFRWMLCAILALLLCCFGAAAEETGMQAVILVDQSASMYSETEANNWQGSGNDAECFRMDAAAALLGMLDVSGDRAGVILYHHALVDGERGGRVYTGRMMPISRSSITNREQMIRMLIEARRGTSGGSDVGKAFMEAQRMLSGGDSGTRRFIVLITDGGHDVRDYLSEGRSKAHSVSEFDSVIAWAKDQNVHVHIVLLKTGAREQEAIRTDYKTAAEKTGGSLHLAEVAGELPAIMANVYAGEVGAQPIVCKGSRVSGMQYSADVSVPNSTVREVSILVPGNENVALFRPDGREARVDNERVYRFDLLNCTLFKLVEPAGDSAPWRVSYDKQDGLGSDVSVVMHYEVTPVLSVEGTVGVGKAESVQASLQFVSPDGQTVRDVALYSGAIAVHLTLQDSRGNRYGAPIRMAAEEDRFAAQFDLAALVPGHLPEPGEWLLKAQILGDGMNEEAAPVPLMLVNNAPVQTQPISSLGSIVIHDPLSDSYREEFYADIALDDYFSDADGDSLSYRLVSVPEAVSVHLEGSHLHVRTLNCHADGEIVLQVQDSDPHTKGTMNAVIPVQVDNVRTRLQNSCTVELLITEGQIGKNEEITLAARLLQDGRQVTDPALLRLLRLQYRQNGAADHLSFTLQPNGEMTTHIKTDVREGEYAFEGSAFIRDFEIAAQPLGFAVGNAAPAVHEGLIDVLPEYVLTDPFLMLGKDEGLQPIDLNRVFTDTADDELSFRAYGIPTAALLAGMNRTADMWAKEEASLQPLDIGEDGVLMLENCISGGDDFPWLPMQHRAVLLMAEDTDGAGVQTLYKCRVWSQRNLLLWGVTALLLAAALTVSAVWMAVNRPWSAEYGILERTNELAALSDKAFPADMPLGSKRSAIPLELIVCSDDFFVRTDTGMLADARCDKYLKALRALLQGSTVRPRRRGDLRLHLASQMPEGMQVYLQHGDERTEVRANAHVTWRMDDTLHIEMTLLAVRLQRRKGNK